MDLAQLLLTPRNTAHRQYEALRAYLVECLPGSEVARRYGYTYGALQQLVHQFLRQPDRQFFVERLRPGAKSDDAIRQRIVELRRQNQSIYDIREALKKEGVPRTPVAVGVVLRKEGFAKLPRRGDTERPPGAEWSLFTIKVHPEEVRAGVEKKVHPGEAAPRLREVDTLIPIGVVSKGSKPGGQHVHEFVVSRIRYSRGYRYIRVAYNDGQVTFTIGQEPATYRCCACGSSQVNSRGQVERRFRSLPIGSRATSVILPIPRVECLTCGVVRQVKIPFADPRRSYTKPFERFCLSYRGA